MFRRAILVLLFGCGVPCAVREGFQRCDRIACPEGSELAGARCVCRSGVVLLGACMSPRDAEAICGRASRPAGGGCQRLGCPEHQTLDQATGVCLPQASLRAVAESMQIPLLGRETIGCPHESDALVVSGANAACVDAASACGPGARSAGRACAPERACAAGEVATPKGTCSRVVFADGSGPVVDVADWVHYVIGPDGGAGSSYLCGAMAAEPWGFTTMTEAQITVTLTVELSFPNNDVGQTRARVQAVGAMGQALSGVDSLVSRLISSLRAMGGTARSAAVQTHVRCSLPMGPRPVAMPISAGDSTR